MGLSQRAWGPVLSGTKVRLEPIDQRLARAIVAGTPDPSLAWEEGFPMPPVVGLARMIHEATVPVGPFLAYVLIRKTDGKAIGDAGFHGPPDSDGELELGYAVIPSARRKGFASEAVGLLIAWAQRQPGVHGFRARVEPGNNASERLLEGLGFARKGERDGMHLFVRGTDA